MHGIYNPLAMTHYLPLSTYPEVPVSLQIKSYGDGAYSKQFMDAAYAKTCLPSCGDLGIPICDDNQAGSCNVFTDGVVNNEGTTNDKNILIGYSNSNNFEDTNSSLEIGYDDLSPMGHDCVRFGRIIQSPGLQLDGLRYESQDRKIDPYSPLCMVPLPGHLMEPSFIRRRNERERERVRCVNEGYDRLKEHLPLENKDKRISKVETLRNAIDYIRSLQRLLDESDGKTDSPEDSSDSQYVTRHRKRRHSVTSNDPSSPDSDL